MPPIYGRAFTPRLHKPGLPGILGATVWPARFVSRCGGFRYASGATAAELCRGGVTMSLSRWRYLAIATLVLLLVPAIAACGTTTTTGGSTPTPKVKVG